MYLAVPNLIFVIGWFLLPAALILCGVLAYLLHSALGTRPLAWNLDRSPGAAALLLVAGFGWAAFGGGSHFMYANHDWVIRDAVLGDLVYSDWPVAYKTPDGTTTVLRSAIGYFLPPALFGKLFGTAHLDIAVYLWTVGGVLIFLGLLPLPRRVGWPLLLGIVVTIFFSGMDYLGLVIATQTTPIFPLRLEWWGPLSYPSLTGQLLWAPNHCLPIWIGTLLILRHRNEDELIPLACALLPLTLIWTPFAAIGLAPFVLLCAWKPFFCRASWNSVPWKPIIGAAIFSLPIILFLLIDTNSMTMVSSSAQVQAAAGSNSANQAVSLHSYLLFVSCEFLLLALALAPHVQRERHLFALALIILLALPLFRFGPSNDSLLRLSTPPLIVLLVFSLHVILRPERTERSLSLWLVWLFLAIGAHTAFNELWRSASFQRWKADYRQTLSSHHGGGIPPHYGGKLGPSPIARGLKPMTHSAEDAKRP
ncbi:MAG: hypothetical protein A3H93_18805 [Rhodocyclales bacterium RIFCSPLOWO2_02_FULL_63_24]|nr:MAG: hypothetical protein A3H93_18805 [Rhodocyclales bacterium RIFCSPLOWO2_02_FULL_63_24]